MSVLAIAGWLLTVQTLAAGTPPYSWGNNQAIVSGQAVNTQPNGLQASNGTLWLAYQSNLNTGSPSRFDVYIKTQTAGHWSPVIQRMTSNGYNSAPYLTQVQDGRIFLFWARQISSPSSLIYYSVFANGAWAAPVSITQTSLNDTQPSAAVGRDGTLYLVWTRVNSTCSTCTPSKHLYYKTLSLGSWSLESLLTPPSDVNWNYGSSVSASKDGRIWVVWSRGIFPAITLYYSYFNGTVWSSSTLITSSTTVDEHPSMVQDRNGTIWLFWGRQTCAPTYALFNKFSKDNGASWSPDSQMTSCASAIDSDEPVAVQGTDKYLHMFYVTDPVGADEIWELSTLTQVYPVNDVAVTSLSANATLIYPGGLASIGESSWVKLTTTLINLGDSSEAVTLTVSVSNTTTTNLGTQTFSLAVGASLTLNFYWNTSFNMKPGLYSLNAVASNSPGETVGNVADNTLTVRRSVHVLPPGDVDQDGSTTAVDVSQVKYAYGSQPCSLYPTNPVCSRFNPYFDINNDQFVGAIDISVTIAHYGIFT